MKRTREQLNIDIINFKVYQENDKWFGSRLCFDCKKEMKYEAQKSCLILRNIRNAEIKNTCCSICSKIGNKNSFFGKKHSIDTKLIQSENRKGKACGENNSMANPIHRKTVSINLKKKYDSGELDFLKKIQKETMIKNILNGKLKPKNISNPEREIKKILEDIGLVIESQFKINSFSYDLYIKNHNILIEYNGDYWHCNPLKYSKNYLNKKKNMYAYELWYNDINKKELAEKNGYKFFTIWENDYKLNKENEIKKIINEL